MQHRHICLWNGLNCDFFFFYKTYSRWCQHKTKQHIYFLTYVKSQGKLKMRWKEKNCQLCEKEQWGEEKKKNKKEKKTVWP